MKVRILPIALACVLSALTASNVAAQTAAPAEGWTGTLAAGLAVTGGNAATTTTNLSFNVTSDKTKQNVFKAEGLNVRASRDGDSIIDRTNLDAQDNYSLSPKAYAFGRFQYLRDVFKSIDYLMAPTGGVGYKVVDSAISSLTADIGVGFVVEKNPGLDRRTNGALTAGQKASHKLSDTATLTQSLSGLWNMSDFGDALLVFQAGIATDITPRTQLKIDFLDTYKNQPPSVLVKKNDTALLMSFGFKF